MSLVSFYCKRCKLDCDLEAGKHGNSFAEWFQAHCPTCQTKLIRYINDKTDPYFYQSIKLRRQRDEFSKDLIQYGEYGFETFYKKQWEEFEKQKENWEKAQIQKRKERDAFYEKHKLNKSFAKKVLEIEEKLEHGGR